MTQNNKLRLDDNKHNVRNPDGDKQPAVSAEKQNIK